MMAVIATPPERKRLLWLSWHANAMSCYAAPLHSIPQRMVGAGRAGPYVSSSAQ